MRDSPYAVVVLEEEGAAAATEGAVGHDGHAVTEEVGLVHEMRRQDDDASVPVLPDQVPREPAAAGPRGWRKRRKTPPKKRDVR